MLPKSFGLKVPLLRSHKDCAWNLLTEVRRAAGDLSCVSFSSEGYSIEYEYFCGYSMRVIPCKYKLFGPKIYETFVREKFKKLRMVFILLFYSSSLLWLFLLSFLVMTNLAYTRKGRKEREREGGSLSLNGCFCLFSIPRVSLNMFLTWTYFTFILEIWRISSDLLPNS